MPLQYIIELKPFSTIYRIGIADLCNYEIDTHKPQGEPIRLRKDKAS